MFDANQLGQGAAAAGAFRRDQRHAVVVAWVGVEQLVREAARYGENFQGIAVVEFQDGGAALRTTKATKGTEAEVSPRFHAATAI